MLPHLGNFCQYLATNWSLLGQYTLGLHSAIGHRILEIDLNLNDSCLLIKIGLCLAYACQFLVYAWLMLGNLLGNAWQCLAWNHILAILEWIHIHSCLTFDSKGFNLSIPNMQLVFCCDLESTVDTMQKHWHLVFLSSALVLHQHCFSITLSFGCFNVFFALRYWKVFWIPEAFQTIFKVKHSERKLHLPLSILWKNWAVWISVVGKLTWNSQKIVDVTDN